MVRPGLRSVAGSVHEDLVVGVDEPIQDDSATTGLGNSRTSYSGARLLVEISGFASDGAVADEPVEVISVAVCSRIASSRMSTSGLFADARSQIIGARRRGRRACGVFKVMSAGWPAWDKCLCYMGFSDADRAVEDDRFAGIQPAQRGHRATSHRVSGLESRSFEGGLSLVLCA